MQSKIESYIHSLAYKRLTSSKIGQFLHCSVIFPSNGDFSSPLSYGENQIRGNSSIHAEANCIDKIPMKRDGKIKKVDLLVIRVTRDGRCTMSKPCMHCISKMNSIICKNYRIRSVYYSNYDGEIEKLSLSKLNKDPHKHISKLNRCSSLLRI
jgi:hypothetical protein